MRSFPVLRRTVLSNRRSWLAIVRFYATPALVIALGCAILFASVVVAFAVARGGEPVVATTPETHSRGERMFVGLVTDDHCGARHEMDSGMNSSECTKMCVRNGSRYVLVQGNKRYLLVGSESKLDGLAGQRANIAGILNGKTIKLSSTNSPR
jgi:hypothetical protein